KQAIMHLRVPAGTPALWMDGLGEPRNPERELLLGRGLTYHVFDAVYDSNRGQWRIYAEIRPAPAQPAAADYSQQYWGYGNSGPTPPGYGGGSDAAGYGSGYPTGNAPYYGTGGYYSGSGGTQSNPGYGYPPSGGSYYTNAPESVPTASEQQDPVQDAPRNGEARTGGRQVSAQSPAPDATTADDNEDIPSLYDYDDSAFTGPDTRGPIPEPPFAGKPEGLDLSSLYPKAPDHPDFSALNLKDFGSTQDLIARFLADLGAPRSWETTPLPVSLDSPLTVFSAWGNFTNPDDFDFNQIGGVPGFYGTSQAATAPQENPPATAPETQ
ncbi:hypothetical protein ACFONH_27465, partial [Streptomonospora nanhaiensis]